MQGFREEAQTIDLAGEQVAAILHHGDASASRGVIIVVGGPQYRVGSHRQFVLLARALSSQGLPVLRFDYRGMGDSSGDTRSFLQCNDDIRCAIDWFSARLPGVKQLVLWGLCDAASACAIYCAGDERVTGLVLLNPWARSEKTEASTYLKHYYTRRIVDPAFWRELLKGRIALGKTLRSLAELVARALGRTSPGNQAAGAESPQSVDFRSSMLNGLQNFTGQTLFIISEDDLTAKEFMDMARGSTDWRKLMARKDIRVETVEGADHTFSSAEYRGRVERLTGNWVQSL